MDAMISDPKLEKAVLYAALLDADIFSEIESIVTPDDFYVSQHGLAFTAIQTVWQQADFPRDMLLLKTELVNLGMSEKDALTMTGDLLSNSSSALNGVKFAEQVSRLSTLRRLVQFAQESVKLAYNSTNTDIGETFARVRKWLDTIQPDATDEYLLTWEKSLDLFYQVQLDRLAEKDREEAGEVIPKVQFPWKALTPRFVRVIRPGMVAVFAADSSVGKTTAMECCADYWAKLGFNVAFFHLELNREFMLDRRMVRWSGEPLATVEGGEITPDIDSAIRKVQQWPGKIHYVHCPGWGAGRISNYMRLLNRKGMCDIAIIDYLQKIRLDSKRGQNEASAWGDVVETIKNASEQLGIVSVIGSQMNRASRMEDRRTAQGIRGSGEPEEKSNIVVTFSRKLLSEKMNVGTRVFIPGDRSPIMDVRVDKNTAGPTGDAQLFMVADRFMITDLQE